MVLIECSIAQRSVRAPPASSLSKFLGCHFGWPGPRSITTGRSRMRVDGVHAVLQRRQIDEGLDRRADLAMRLGGAVELDWPSYEQRREAGTRPVWGSSAHNAPETLESGAAVDRQARLLIALRRLVPSPPPPFAVWAARLDQDQARRASPSRTGVRGGVADHAGREGRARQAEPRSSAASPSARPSTRSRRRRAWILQHHRRLPRRRPAGAARRQAPCASRAVSEVGWPAAPTPGHARRS